MNSLQSIQPPTDDLLLVVLGPGFGESVVVGWPPDNWLVIDSFQRKQTSCTVHPALELLTRLGAFADAVVLTHPHIDHTNGFEALIDRLKPDGLVGWWPDISITEGWDTNNGGQSQRRNAAEHAIAAIERAWRETPSSRWELSERAAPLKRAGATISALTPLASTLARAAGLKAPDMNELSTAIRFEWEAVSLILGGDLVNRRGWDGLAVRHGQGAFANTEGAKVAHHGSQEAQHAVWLGTPPPTDRVFLATPYNRGRKVPDYGPGADVSRLLAVMNRLLISAHHGPRPPGTGSANVRMNTLKPTEKQLPHILVELDATTPDVQECWVAARWSPNGSLIGTMRGAGSMSVVV